MSHKNIKRTISILLAEDDPTMRQLIATLLSRRGIPCTLVENGRSAVDAWEEHGFDLILMDIQMPILDGLKATRMIREKERVKGGHTVIIAMTAHAMAKDKEICLEAGMDAYISKPVKFDELLSLISRYSTSTSKNNTA